MIFQVRNSVGALLYENDKVLFSGSQRQPLFSARQKVVGEGRQIQVDLRVFASSAALATNNDATMQASVKANLDDLHDTVTTRGISVGLRHDDGTVSHHWLDGPSSDDGVKLVRWQTPQITDREYSYMRTVSLSFAGRYYDVTEDNEVADFAEQISWQVGVSNIGWRNYITGPPRKWVINQQTPHTLTQRGRALGLNGYPLFPGYLVTTGDIIAETHDRFGPQRIDKSLLNFGTSWSVTYRSEFSYFAVSPHAL